MAAVDQDLRPTVVLNFVKNTRDCFWEYVFDNYVLFQVVEAVASEVEVEAEEEEAVVVVAPAVAVAASAVSKLFCCCIDCGCP